MNKQKRTKRSFSDEFKRDAVELVTKQGYSVPEAAKNLGIGAGLLRRWKKKIEDEKSGVLMTEDEKAELKRLRKENQRLKMEREILKKAAAFFAKESE